MLGFRGHFSSTSCRYSVTLGALRRARRRFHRYTSESRRRDDVLDVRDLSPLMSEHGVPLEEISRLVGNSGTAVTEAVYRHELRPVLQTGARAMDDLFSVMGVEEPPPKVDEAGGRGAA